MKRFGRRIAASLLSLILMAGLLPAAGAASTPQMGDINGDGYADSGDALLALRFAVDDYTLTDTQKILADVTYDGMVNAGDAVRILRYDVGLVDSLGKVPSESPVYFMLSTTDRESLKYDNEYYWVYEDAYINGERHELIVNYDWNNDGTKDSPLSLGALYRIDETTDGDYITKLSKVTTEMMVCAGEGFTVGDKAFWLDTAESETFKFDVDDSTIFVYGEYDYATDEYSFCEGNLKDMKDDDVTKVWVIEAEGSCARLVYIYAEANVPEDVPSANRVITYTVSVSNMGIYEALGTTLIEDYAWIAYVNGEEQADIVLPVKNDQAEWIYTGEGTVTEIHVNDQAETVTLYEINHYLGQVTSVRTDEKGEYITVKEFSEGSSLNDHTYYIDGFEVGDYVVYTQDVNADGKNVIGKASAPKIVTTEITAVHKDADTGAAYAYGGDVKYIYTEDEGDAQDHMVYDLDEPNMKMHPVLNEYYTLYLDPNGYVLAYKRIAEPSRYLYVKDSDEEMGEWVAKVLLDDGTTQIIEIDEDEYDVSWLDSSYTKTGSNIDGKIFKYIVNAKGEYDLDAIIFEADADGVTDWGNQDEQDGWYNASIIQGKAYITNDVSKVIVDRNTLFIDDENETTYVGYNNVPSIDDATIAYVINGKIVVAAFILDGEIYDTCSSYFMLTSTNRETIKHDSKLYWRYLDAYVDGTQETLMVAYNYDGMAGNDSVLNIGVLYKVKKTVDEDYIVELEAAETVASGIPSAVGDAAFWLGDNEVMFNTDANTIYVYTEYDEEVEEWSIFQGALADMKNDDVFAVWVVEADEEYAQLVYIIAFIAKENDNTTTQPTM